MHILIRIHYCIFTQVLASFLTNFEQHQQASETIKGINAYLLLLGLFTATSLMNLYACLYLYVCAKVCCDVPILGKSLALTTSMRLWVTCTYYIRICMYLN